ncbi:MAG: FtsH protease activity modulator HflK [Gammaproteobacteria bacterium]|nr:MAG: FtsH protease activity modulator HflK [Gammaproteobacteria bacterium]
MSWNEPGEKNKDPWSGRDKQQGPPDLDEALKSFQEKISNIFGGKSGNGGDGGGNGIINKTPGSFGIGLLAGIGLLVWGLSGIYIIDEGNRGVILRFGKYIETTQPGPHWRLPAPIDELLIVNVEQQRFIEVGYRSGGGQGTSGSVPREALMLTRDENIVDVRLAVQYTIKDAKNFLFSLKDPSDTLKQAIESAQRAVVGQHAMDFLLTEGRSQVGAKIEKDIQTIMDSYQSGIRVTSVNLQDAQPPEQVQGAFEDAIKAREDEQRLKNEAETYSNEVIPKARGAAARLTQEAEGYKAKTVAEAEGNASRFSQLLTEYEKAPEVTRKRLYIDAMEIVLSNSEKVLVDVKNGNNLLYLPLDKLSGGSARQINPGARPVYITPTQDSTSQQKQPIRSSSREGRGR